MNLANASSRPDGWQQRRRLLGVPVAVMMKFLDDGADAVGVQIAYWGFFSVFAVLLVFTSVLGFVFQNDPSVQQQLLDSTLERMPVIGPQISGDIGTLTGSGVAVAIGVIGGLWTGLGVTLAIGNALDRIWGGCRLCSAVASSARACAGWRCSRPSAASTFLRPRRSA